MQKSVFLRSAFIGVGISLLSLAATAQQKAENVIIITLDGMRWQEVFKGADSLIAVDKNFNHQDSG